MSWPQKKRLRYATRAWDASTGYMHAWHAVHGMVALMRFTYLLPQCVSRDVGRPGSLWIHTRIHRACACKRSMLSLRQACLHARLDGGKGSYLAFGCELASHAWQLRISDSRQLVAGLVQDVIVCVQPPRLGNGHRPSRVAVLEPYPEISGIVHCAYHTCELTPRGA